MSESKLKQDLIMLLYYMSFTTHSSSRSRWDLSEGKLSMRSLRRSGIMSCCITEERGHSGSRLAAQRHRSGRFHWAPCCKIDSLNLAQSWVKCFFKSSLTWNWFLLMWVQSSADSVNSLSRKTSLALEKPKKLIIGQPKPRNQDHVIFCGLSDLTELSVLLWSTVVVVVVVASCWETGQDSG